ncbi:hypothetical protein JG688_00012697 [Phytophthora aleatoria]|uniref:Uncharacterized protein n=1 Tax=Phytophthora aleatoria TaxID=2496075 RepID=A0A8J5IEU8_9STRA|nr:hypothetical protein JG688_00012697 [Phytophthora aleatoria]
MPADFSSAEVSFVHALRALQNGPKFSIRRRRTSGRGDCPVSGNTSAVSGGLPPHSIATAPAGALSLLWNPSIVPDAPLGPVGPTEDGC